jgi:lipoprotein-releasing system permease protein
VTRVLSLRIAWRFLTSSPGQSTLIACGIAVGIATQIFVGSIIFSLQDNLLETTIGSAPQVTIQAIKESDPVRFTPKMKDLVYNDPRVKPGSVAPVRSVPALFSNGTDSSTLGLIGGNLKDLDGIYKLSDKTIEGKASLGNGEIMIGKEFAEKFNISPGDAVALSLQGGQSGTFTVTGIFDLGSSQFNARQAFVSGKVPQTVLGWANDEYQAVDVQLNEPYDSKAVASAWSSQLPGVSVVEWQGQNASLLAGLTAQSASSYMIQGFVLIAVALGIASTLAIAAVQKTRQIGILKAMGLADRPAGRIFLWQAAVLGVAGSTLGIIFSFGILALFRLSPAPFSIMMDPKFVGISWMIGVSVAMLSSIVPIRRTSKLDPIEVIQNG